jgi:type III secretory pathway component EscU
MKRFTKIFLVLLLIVFLLADYSCQRRTCKYMKYYKKDVKRGLAH